MTFEVTVADQSTIQAVRILLVSHDSTFLPLLLVGGWFRGWVVSFSFFLIPLRFPPSFKMFKPARLVDS